MRWILTRCCPRRAARLAMGAAIVAAAAAVVRRWGRGALALSPWELAAAVTGGRLLAPGTGVGVINTSCPW